MKTVLFLFILLPMLCFAQRDSVYLEFIPQNDTFPGCRAVYAVNGKYSVHPSPALDEDISGFIFVNPGGFDHYAYSEFTRRIIFHSNAAEWRKYGSFEYPANYYVPISYDDMDTLIARKLRTQYKITQKYFWERDYIANGFVKNPYKLEIKEEPKDTVETQSGLLFGPVNVPSEGIIDGVFIGDPYLQRLPYFQAHPEDWDSIQRIYSGIRSAEIQPLIDSILQPFYMSRTEVTNKEYREFVNEVRDSIIVHTIYNNAPDDMAMDFLNTSKRNKKKLDPSDKKGNYERYGLRKFTYKDSYNADYRQYFAELYYPQPKRFYFRREYDVRNIIYKQSDSSFIAIYPDTAGFDKTGTFVDPLINMYFWHPAYDNYPVLNLSYDQMQAYCQWKQRKVNETLKLEEHMVLVSLPTITQYEFALQNSIAPVTINKAVDQQNDHYFTNQRSDTLWTQYYISQVFATATSKGGTRHPAVDYQLWYNFNANPDYYFLNGNGSEVVRDEVTNEKLHYYGIPEVDDPENYVFVLGGNFQTDIKSKGDDQYNAVFYKTINRKEQADCHQGFRLVYMIVPK